MARLKTGPLLLKTGSFLPRSNMMMAKSAIKVLDFGLAKSGADDTVTDAGRGRSANGWWSAGCFRRDSVVRRPTGGAIARACSRCPSKDMSNPFLTKDGKRTASRSAERTPGGRLEVLIAFDAGEIRGAFRMVMACCDLKVQLGVRWTCGLTDVVQRVGDYTST